ncbi:MAG: zinc ribbon domain-containing protein [Opitutales bacterium]|nr:zinc ribbon domain-containing protein [Opitutales bacterium]
MKCSYCNNEIPQGASKCPACGASIDASALQGQSSQPIYAPQNTQPQFAPQYAQQQPDKASIWLQIVSFIIPIVGIILWVAKRKTSPIAAKSYLNVAIAGMVVNIIYAIVN